MKLSASFRPQAVSVAVNAETMGVTLGSPVARDYVERPAYEGPTEVTPSSETQTLDTRNFRMTENVTVNPIPSNYGLITWNGAGIKVS